MKKVMLFVATEKGFSVLKSLCERYKTNIGAVVSFHETGVCHDWFDDISGLCDEQNIPFYAWSQAKINLKDLIIKNAITGILCISWRYMMPLSLNELLEDDMIVFHDSLLPNYRGFNPMVTAMICGDAQVGATALFAADKVDAGDIICQRTLSITSDDYIEDVIEKVSDLYVEMACFVFEKMTEGALPRTLQDESKASYSLWRDEVDYWIDWSKSADEINRFIHAVGYPYKGALTTDLGEKIRIIKSAVVEEDLYFPIRTYGKIWSLTETGAIVVCGDGMLEIKEAVKEDGQSYKFTRLRSRLGDKLEKVE